MLRNMHYIIALLLTLILVFAMVTTSYAYESYTVKAGDSLFKISKKFNLSVSTLAKINDITNLNLIYSGQRIKLPATEKKTSSNSSVVKATSEKDYKRTSSNLSNSTKSNSTKYSTSYSNFNWKEDKDNVVKAKPQKESEVNKVYRRGPKTMQVALTFDDGPDPVFTPQVLDVLKENNVKATFFLVGKRVTQNPSIVKRIYEEGHTIASHSWSHADLVKLNQDELAKEVIDTEEAIENIIDRKTGLIRPPYGSISDTTLDQLQNMGYKVINWSIDSLDWKAKNKEEVIERTVPDFHKGAIILFHSAGGKGQSLLPTINALETIINELKAKNFKMVTVNDLLSLSAYKS
ncbi:polysaccharide deacetylase family protein [Orenia marismortui]|uniref:polysaccharide deacetylase family protein n=1 Tax=Orenia marismortui TaxID=46469 RepID=UPI00036FBA8D|nr:polysaccharide deacetylase family protein [Orenia marismortui]